MTEEKENKKIEEVVENSASATPKDNTPKEAVSSDVKTEDKKTENNQTDDQGKKIFKKNFRKRGNFSRERVKPEFEQKILSIRRVTRVVAGGRRFSFAVSLAIGDKKGRVGVGTGKAGDTSDAIQKAFRNAKKKMIKIKLGKNNAVPYDVKTKYSSSVITIRPVSGKGLAAGGAVRTVLELVGADETGGKILSRSKNHLNNAMATIKALKEFSVEK